MMKGGVGSVFSQFVLFAASRFSRKHEGILETRERGAHSSLSRYYRNGLLPPASSTRSFDVRFLWLPAYTPDVIFEPGGPNAIRVGGFGGGSSGRPLEAAIARATQA